MFAVYFLPDSEKCYIPRKTPDNLPPRTDFKTGFLSNRANVETARRVHYGWISTRTVQSRTNFVVCAIHLLEEIRYEIYLKRCYLITRVIHTVQRQLAVDEVRRRRRRRVSLLSCVFFFFLGMFFFREASFTPPSASCMFSTPFFVLFRCS